MKRFSIPTILLAAMAACLMSLSCGGKESDVLATIGDKTITLGDFNVAHSAISVFSRPPLLTFEDKENFLNTLINKEILMGEAYRQGLDRDPTVTAARERWSQEYILRALFKEISEKDLDIKLDDVKEYYRKSRAKIHARQIVVASPDVAKEIREKLMSGGDFASMARRYSIDEATASKGGDLGVLGKDTTNPTIQQVAANLGVGEISRVIQSQDGYHIIEVLSVEDPDMDQFEAERHLCAAELRNEKRNAAWQAFLKKQSDDHNVKFNEETVQWLNDRLPPRGPVDFTWQESVGEDDKERVIVSWDGGSYTVGKFMTIYSPRSGRGSLFTSEGGNLLKRILEGEILNQLNMVVAKEMGIDKYSPVKRDIAKKVDEQILDVLHGRITADVTVPEDSLKARYEKLKETLVAPEMVEFRMISSGKKKVVEEARERVLRGEDFEAVARDVNRGDMRESGGFVGPVNRDVVQIPDLRTTLFDQLSPGEMSSILSPPGRGYLLVKLLKKTPEHPMTYEEALAPLKTALQEEAENRYLNEWLKKKREELHVKVYPEVLNKLSEGEEEATS